MADVICLGEALIDFVSLESGVDLIQAPGFMKAPGGAPANVACGVAKLGVSSAFIGKVGDDPFGRFLERTFAGAGVDTSRMVFAEEARTGLAFVSLTSEGDRDFAFWRNPSADMLLNPHEIDEAFIAAGKVFHFGSITRIVEPSRSATLRAIEVARQNGLLISYDPNLRESLWDSLEHAKQEMIAGLENCDLLKVSEEELALITGERDIPPAAAQLVEQGIALVSVTRGPQGCYYANANGAGWVEGHEVSVADTTGCGDGFVAGMIVKALASASPPGELNEDELRDTFVYANAVGALTATQKGAIPALPTPERVEQFLADTSQADAPPRHVSTSQSNSGGNRTCLS
ncbi:MAG: PfkB family carbohydrate kinase [Armatimonadota bacterium]